MSRGLGAMERRLLAEVERYGDEWTALKDLASSPSELASLKRAAKSLEAKGLAGVVYVTRDGRRSMCVTAPLLSVVVDAATGRTAVKDARQIRADELRRRIAGLDAKRAALQAQLDRLMADGADVDELRDLKEA